MIRIGGWSRLSSCDWPGRLVTTVFCQGCPWRCGYCHNPALLPPRSAPVVSWRAVTSHLARRRGLLDGIVFSGGEPLLQPGLADALREARALGFATGLHTGGAYPRRFAQLLSAGLLDWVGFDVKAAPAAYEKVTGVPNSAAPATRSLRLLLDAGLPHQIRTTIDPALLDRADVAELERWVAAQGVRGHVTTPARFKSPAAGGR
ncbi:anaerobic ribonucleoside-triphosphate reductase activating protein [Streptomyces xanthochromogenes]|uniref:Anaerobic ribonucleoside-triphosphate reductase activating protein n=1 Tax=Streptomyces xanthochromogenes TaxID=67384 RepID=A0ABQ2ZHQ0_9ACTN|nr:anaerobic ribonucleoside-triphosphate reductase activating protein [Streptomyces xanthochromogenes]GGY16766.1 anaerobic ribonucleoside-triphosphate reductase activating protein [Streptomyces xanthochromogenes]